MISSDIPSSSGGESNVVDGDRHVVVGVLYPPDWYGDRGRFDAEIDALRAIDDRIDVVVERYDEPHARRAGAPDMPPEPELSEAQRAAFARIEVALTIDLPTNLAELAPNLRWVQSIAAGPNHLVPKVRTVGARLTNNGGSNAVGIAEFVMARILEHWKALTDIGALQRDHRWEARFGRELAGSTLGLLGFGPINQAVAARATAFGMRVLVVRRSPGDVPPGIERVVGEDGLLEVLGESDVVVSAVPETPATIGMIGAAQFAAMPGGAFFCNVGRGSLVDEPALIAALHAGHLGGAAIDVAHVEPLPAGDPLWDAPRLRISAHCSSVPASMFPGMHRTFRDNVVRYLAGEPLAGEVDLG